MPLKKSCGRRNRNDDYNFGELQILGPLFFSHIRKSSLLVLDVAKPVFLKLSILLVQVGGYSKATCTCEKGSFKEKKNPINPVRGPEFFKK